MCACLSFTSTPFPVNSMSFAYYLCGSDLQCRLESRGRGGSDLFVVGLHLVCPFPVYGLKGTDVKIWSALVFCMTGVVCTCR